MPWAQMPIHGSSRAHGSLPEDNVLVTGAPGSGQDEGIAPEGTDADTVPESTEPESDEQPEEANTDEGP